MVAVVEEKSKRGYREIVFLGLSSFALFFLIALITFNLEDPSWNHSTSFKPIHNACGLTGAWLADFMLSFLGVMAYLIPVMIFWYGYLLFTPDDQALTRVQIAIRATGFVATMTAGSAIFFLHFHFLRTKLHLPDSPGGIVGREVGDTLVHLLGNSGSTLFLQLLFMAGITLLTGLSWLAVMNSVGKLTLTLFSFAGQQAATGAQRYRNNEEEPAASPAPRVETRKPKLVIADVEPEVEEKPKKSKLQILKKIEQPVLQEPEVFKPVRKKDTKTTEDFDDDKFLNALPTLSLLDKREIKVKRYSKAELQDLSRRVEEVLKDFGISVEVEAVLPGPVITRFELRLAAGVKGSRITGLAKDLARGLSVTSVRVVEIIEGKSVIGLEIPNQEREMVSLRDLLVSDEFEGAKSKLSIAMGKDISGKPVVADLGKMPQDRKSVV